MNTEKHIIWEEGEYTYPMACGFVPNIVSYLHETKAVRPVILVIPGGAYMHVSPTEAGIVAEKFAEFDFQTFVLTYTINREFLAPLRDQPLKDVSRAIRYIRANAESLGADPDRIIVCGFSAGGHLAASVCVHYGDAPDQNPRYELFSNRPGAGILCYPVITTGQYAHQESVWALLGKTADEDELAYQSLETQVTEHTPPCFLWQTRTDEQVPVENSYLFSEALHAHGIPYALHIFSQGNHGLSLANEIWATEQYGEPYTTEQVQRIYDAVLGGKLYLDSDAREGLEAFVNRPPKKKAVNAEVAVWPTLAAAWVRQVMG